MLTDPLQMYSWAMRCEFTCTAQKPSSSLSARACHPNAQDGGGNKTCSLNPNVKSLLIFCVLFCNMHGIVHHEFVPQGKIVNRHYYIDTLWLLEESVW